MPRTVKVDFEKGDIVAHSNNLLNGAKGEKLIEIGQYHIKTSIDVSKVQATEVKKKAAVMEAQKEADHFTNERFKEIEKLVGEVKKLLEKDKKGDGTAGSTAVTLVKSTSDEIDDTLVDFGKLIRKAIEKQTGKLPTSVKSASMGQFRGLKLLAKFENSGASGLKVKIDEPVKKWLNEKEPILLKEATEGIKITGEEYDGLKKVGSLYQIRGQKNPEFYVICKVEGETLKMLAIYQITNAGKKTFVVGEEIKSFG